MTKRNRSTPLCCPLVSETLPKLKEIWNQGKAGTKGAFQTDGSPAEWRQT